jgi:hypothetical protein
MITTKKKYIMEKIILLSTLLALACAASLQAQSAEEYFTKSNNNTEKVIWGNFLTKELGIKIDKNTEKTIQTYFGALPDIVQKEIESFFKTNKSLFFDLETTIYGLDNLLDYSSKQKLIDNNGTYITPIIFENKNYLPDEQNLDKIDEMIKVWWKSLDGMNDREEVTMAVLELHYKNEQDPAKKEKIGGALSKLKKEYESLNKQRENRYEAEKKANEAEKILYEKTLQLYKEYKKDGDPAALKLLIETVEVLKEFTERPLAIQDMMDEIEKIKNRKK